MNKALLLKKDKTGLVVAAEILKQGGIGVFPSDTLYGIFASALVPEAVERVYRLRGRDRHKPMIVALASVKELSLFGIKLIPRTTKFLRAVWPGQVSVVLACSLSKFKYLHRGTKTLAFRIPRDGFFRDLLRLTGPLVVPSANSAGLTPAFNVAQARRYFGEKSDFYLEAGKLVGLTSTVVQFGKSGQVKILRQGTVKPKKAWFS